mgnify:CR=1 FL=1
MNTNLRRAIREYNRDFDADIDSNRRHLYFAYGMNTNIDQMAYRCPAAVCLGRYDLQDHRLVFRGVADAVYSEGDVLQTVLWDITPECERELDILEGYPYLYDKKEVLVYYNNVYEYAMMYYMIDQYRSSQPSKAYEMILKEGSEEYMETVLESMISEDQSEFCKFMEKNCKRAFCRQGSVCGFEAYCRKRKRN